MPSACPQCHTYDGLTTLIDGDTLKPNGKIQCENCLWVGEPDELDEVDRDD